MKDLVTKALLLAVIVLVFVASFYQVLIKLSYRLGGGDFDYCYIVPFIFLYVLWEMRHKGTFGAFGSLGALGTFKGKTNKTETSKLDEKVNIDATGPGGFRFGEFSWSAWGLIPIALSLVIIFMGELGSIETLMYVGIWGCVFGLGYCLYGRRVQKLSFAFLMLLFIVPLPHYLNQSLTFQLRLAASSIATKMLMLSGVSVFREGNIIDIGVTQLQVVDACSGLRYLMPLLLLALLVGYFFSRGWWRRAALVIAVVPLSIFLNAFRIWLTGILTVKGHAELAQNLFHDFSGWLIFMIAGAVLYGVSIVLKRFGVQTVEQKTIDPGGKPVKALRPVVLSAAICLVFAGSGWGLKQIPSADHLPQGALFEHFPMQVGEWEGKRGHIPKEDLDSLWADDYVMANFFRSNSPNVIQLLIPFYRYQSSMHTAHAPQACLLGGGWSTLKSENRAANLGSGQSIPIQTMLMQKGDSRLLSSYFFFQRGRVTTSPWWNKLYLMYDAFTKRRTDGALVRVEMTLAPGQTEEQAFPVLEGFIAELWKILPAYVPL